MPEPFPGGAALAPLRIRLAALVYEALLLAALLIAATAIFVAVAGDSREQPLLRLALQVYLLAVTAVYFVWSWSGGRRTLSMRTWRLRLVDTRGNPPDARTALVRFLLLVLSLPIGGAGFWWALVDRDRLYLHDRVAGTRLVRDPRSASRGRARTRA